MGFSEHTPTKKIIKRIDIVFGVIYIIADFVKYLSERRGNFVQDNI